MSRREELEALAGRWADDAEVLIRWGFEFEAEAIRVCRSDLKESLAGQGADRIDQLADTWEEEADILAEYGHSEEASAVQICAEHLRSALAGTETRGEPSGPSTPPDSDRQEERPGSAPSNRDAPHHVGQPTGPDAGPSANRDDEPRSSRSRPGRRDTEIEQ